MPQARDEAGNIWEVDAQGNAINLVQAAEAQSQQPPADPTFEYQAPQAQADLGRVQAQTQGSQIDNSVTAATAPTTIQTNEAPAGYIWIDPSDPSQGVRPIPGYTPSGGKQVLDPQKLGNMRALQNLLDDLQTSFDAGPGSTGSMTGFMDYLPTDENKQFDTLAASLGDVGFAAFRIPGSGVQTDADQKRFIDANTPSAGDRDVVIQQKLQNVRNRLDESVKAFGMTPEEFRAPASSQEGGAIEQARNQLRMGAPQQQKAAGVGAETTTAPLPEGYLAESDELLTRLLTENGGRLPVDEYAAGMTEIERKYEAEIAEVSGMGGLNISPDKHRVWAEGYNEYLEAGGRKVPPQNSSIEVPLSSFEQLHNDVVSTPLGAGAVGVANAGSFGAVNALVSEKSRALRDEHPLSSLAGEVAGGITGTALISRAGGELAKRAAPQLLQGGGRGQLGRNLATDGTYAGAYSANSDENVGMGIGLGLGGSLLGQAAGRGIGAGVGGIQRSEPVKNLLDRGVSLTVGRQLGDAGSRFEDLVQSIPGVGGRVRDRMGESFVDFNQAAFDEAAKPIDGFSPQAIGREGVGEFNEAVSGAYNQALAGRNIPLDEAALVDDLAPAVKARGQLPDEVAGRADKLIGNHLDPIQQAGKITGETFQRAARGLKGARNNASQIAGEFDQPYRETMTGVIDALDAQIARSADADVLPKLGAANEAYRNLSILENASLDRARVGTRTGQTEVFAPSQLIDAARSAEKKYPGSEALLQLGKDGQDVLPQTVPNSGTTDRAIAASTLGAFGIGASGVGFNDTGVTYDSTNAAGAGGIAGALALLGTRGGQQALSKVLFERPTVAQQVGRSIQSRSGLFGSAGRQYALQGQ